MVRVESAARQTVPVSTSRPDDRIYLHFAFLPLTLLFSPTLYIHQHSQWLSQTRQRTALTLLSGKCGLGSVGMRFGIDAWRSEACWRGRGCKLRLCRDRCLSSQQEGA